MQWLVIGLGAALGACLRGYLARFNPLHHWIPLGTLSANVLGGLLIGLALVWFERMGSDLSPNIRLFVITGFLGGLTTFSTFSAEVFTFISAGKLLAGLGLIGLHVGLTLLATAAGFYFFKLVL
ncbi:CrcB family protein [uncultured Psychrobacter sp.]|uniref:CrcB family protein n=1 Tax=uncultured Psychrobacter sp. TaxID=259303 RepID=UPI0025953FCC|nr:CrcB family protein [uncultured Psychrobacter sp.]